MAARRSEPTSATADTTRRTRNVTETGSVVAAGAVARVSVAGGVAPGFVPDFGVALGLALGVGAAQDELSMVLLSIVTAPFCARARPCSVAPLLSAIEVRVMIVPLNDVEVPRVAELPT